MKIGLIRHFPVKHPFLKGWVRQSEMLNWFNAYNSAPVKESAIEISPDWQRCYSSQLPRAVTTATLIFSGHVEQSEFLNEPGPFKIFKKDVRLPFLAWAILIRWAIHRSWSKTHGRAGIEIRIRQFMQQVKNEDENILIVSHALVMEILSNYLIQQGFRGRKLTNPKNGVLHIFDK